MCIAILYVYSYAWNSFPLKYLLGLNYMVIPYVYFLIVYAGDLELLYIAKHNVDATTCARLARDVARYINSRMTDSARRRRQVATDSTSVDPIFNYMTVASALEQEMHNDTSVNGRTSFSSGAVMLSAPSALIFTLVAFVLLKLTLC